MNGNRSESLIPNGKQEEEEEENRNEVRTGLFELQTGARGRFCEHGNELPY
jgi:hypothetical protein